MSQNPSAFSPKTGKMSTTQTLKTLYAIKLQTGCVVIVSAPVVEAAKLPRVCPMASCYGLPPFNTNNEVRV